MEPGCLVWARGALYGPVGPWKALGGLWKAPGAFPGPPRCLAEDPKDHKAIHEFWVFADVALPTDPRPVNLTGALTTSFLRSRNYHSVIAEPFVACGLDYLYSCGNQIYAPGEKFEACSSSHTSSILSSRCRTADVFSEDTSVPI